MKKGACQTKVKKPELLGRAFRVLGVDK